MKNHPHDPALLAAPRAMTPKSFDTENVGPNHNHSRIGESDIFNLYLIRHLVADGNPNNLDWHVIAGTPRQARDLWAAFTTGYLDALSDDEDTNALTGDDADHVHPVLEGVPGPARVLPWRHA